MATEVEDAGHRYTSEAFEGDVMTVERHAQLFRDFSDEDAAAAARGATPADTTLEQWRQYQTGTAGAWATVIMHQECIWRGYRGGKYAPVYKDDSFIVERGIHHAVACRAVPGFAAAVVTNGVGYAAVEICDGAPQAAHAIKSLVAGDWDAVRRYLYDQIRVLLSKPPQGSMLGADPRPPYPGEIYKVGQHLHMRL